MGFLPSFIDASVLIAFRYHSINHRYLSTDPSTVRLNRNYGPGSRLGMGRRPDADAVQQIMLLAEFFGGFGVIAMMLNIVADVVAKLVWNAPIQGTVEMSSYYYMVALVMLPMAFVEMQDQQISVDLLFNHFPAWLQKLALIFSCLAAATILAVMTWRTGLDAMRALRVGENGHDKSFCYKSFGVHEILTLKRWLHRKVYLGYRRMHSVVDG